MNDCGTSHFSVIDSRRNAVACTETISRPFGSKLVEPRFGIMLDNQMDDFSKISGQPNSCDLIQRAANSVAPGKRLLSSMSPAIVLDHVLAKYVAGPTGGPRIIFATRQVLLNQMRFNMTPAQAVRSPQFYHQWLPNVLHVEAELTRDVHTAQNRRGHTIRDTRPPGASQTVVRCNDGQNGASNLRRSGRRRLLSSFASIAADKCLIDAR